MLIQIKCLAHYPNIFYYILTVPKETKKKTGLKKHPCQFCGEELKSDVIRRHEIYKCNRNPNRKKGQYCTLCRILCPAEDYQRHIAEKHPDGMKLICDICGNYFACINNLNRHQMAVHFGDKTKLKRFVCDDCGKDFNSKDHLQRHKRTHSGRYGLIWRPIDRSVNVPNTSFVGWIHLSAPFDISAAVA